MACAWLLVAKGRFTTDLTLFMPEPSTRVEQLLLDQLREGPAARLMLMALQGGSEAARATVSKALARELRASGLFFRVANGELTAAENSEPLLFRYRYLLAPDEDPKRFGAEALRAALQQRLRELAAPLASLDKNRLPADPTAAFRALMQAWRPISEPLRREGLWFSPTGERALLFAETRAPGYDMDAQAHTVRAIEQRFQRVRQTPEVQLLLSGPAAFAVESRHTIRTEAGRISLAASLFLILFLGFVYRSPRLLLLAAVPLLTGTVVAATVVSLAFGALHGITLAFGVTLLGVAVDYPLHLFSHAHSPEPVENTLKRIWPTLRLGVITTVMGYAAMSWTDFRGMAQLGVFAASGLLAAAACSRWVLPRLFPRDWAPPYDSAQSRWTAPLRPRARHADYLLAAVAVIALWVLFSNRESLWEQDLAALSPIPASARTLDRTLRHQMGAPDVRHVVLVTAPDAETALRRAEGFAPKLETLVSQGLLEGFDMASRYLPSQATQRTRQAGLPAKRQLEADLAAALSGLPFKRSLFVPFVQAVAASRQLTPLGPEDLQGSTLALRVAPLLQRRQEGWVALMPLSGIRDEAALAAELKRHSTEDVHYVDLKAVSNDAVNHFRDRALRRMAWAAALVLLVLSISLRNPWRVLGVSLPLFIAVAVDLALLVGLGQRLSLFHLMALLLVVGIGIDYGLFFGLPHQDSAMRRRTHHALSVCAISSVSVFGLLAFSQIPILRAIGSTVALGVLVAFLAAMVYAQRWRVVPYTSRALS